MCFSTKIGLITLFIILSVCIFDAHNVKQFHSESTMPGGELLQSKKFPENIIHSTYYLQ